MAARRTPRSPSIQGDSVGTITLGAGIPVGVGVGVAGGAGTVGVGVGVGVGSPTGASSCRTIARVPAGLTAMENVVAPERPGWRIVVLTDVYGGFKIATPSSPAIKAAALTGLKATALGELKPIGSVLIKAGLPVMLITFASGAGIDSST